MTVAAIPVLLAAQSQANRRLLKTLLESDPQLRLVAVAESPGELPMALRATLRSPTVIVIDLTGRGQRELQALAGLMQEHPFPVVVCGDGPGFQDTPAGLEARRAGAVACVDRPESLTGRTDLARIAYLVHTLKLMSEVRVVRRHPGRAGAAAVVPHARTAEAEPGLVPATPAHGAPRVVGIGASTGGPPVLHALLAGLPADFPLPVLVVQHIAPGFLPGLVQWLGQATPLPVHVAAHGMLALPGHVYLAPDGSHLGLAPRQQIVLSQANPENHVRPSVSFLLRTLVQTCGPAAIGVLLTGMGRDGADELKRLRDAGGITIAQDEQSSIVHGMAGAAIAGGAASLVLPADRIASALVALAAGEPVSTEWNPP